MAIEIVFETHSTSIDNERGIATGWLDGQLSATGRQQAVELGARRRDDRLAAVFTSDLGRAVETARIAFGDSEIPVYEDARLRECNYGRLNGTSRAQLDLERAQRLDEPFPEGESWRQATGRVGDFLNGLGPGRDGERILLIGHVATRWGLDHFLNGTPLEELVDEPFAWQKGWEYGLRRPATGT
jgi:2,3-bisphosphoglycerate-dependent phosphoglycerate mutase